MMYDGGVDLIFDVVVDDGKVVFFEVFVLFWIGGDENWNVVDEGVVCF